MGIGSINGADKTEKLQQSQTKASSGNVNVKSDESVFNNPKLKSDTDAKKTAEEAKDAEEKRKKEEAKKAEAEQKSKLNQKHPVKNVSSATGEWQIATKDRDGNKNNYEDITLTKFDKNGKITEYSLKRVSNNESDYGETFSDRIAYKEKYTALEVHKKGELPDYTKEIRNDDKLFNAIQDFINNPNNNSDVKDVKNIYLNTENSNYTFTKIGDNYTIKQINQKGRSHIMDDGKPKIL